MTLEHSLIEYPSDFPIKVFGQSQQGFTQAVIEVITQYSGKLITALHRLS